MRSERLCEVTSINLLRFDPIERCGLGMCYISLVCIINYHDISQKRDVVI